jgi:hypothetical protein
MQNRMKTKRPYTRTEMLAYWNVCASIVDDAVDALNLNDPKSGFSWIKVPKMESQIINIRHIQYHEAQLADRLRVATGVGVDWAEARRRRKAR